MISCGTPAFNPELVIIYNPTPSEIRITDEVETRVTDEGDTRVTDL